MPQDVNIFNLSDNPVFAGGFGLAIVAAGGSLKTSETL
jgi:hypothetical protein